MLTETALGIEPDDNRVWEALTELANPELVFSALTAGYGPNVAEMAARAIRDTIDRATVSIGTAATITPTSELFGRWNTERQWTEWEQALLATAGRALAKGLLVDQICKLIDRTDDVCLAEARRLSTDGDRTAVSRVVAATYIQSAAQPNGRALAASYIVRAIEIARMMRRSAPDERPRGLAGRLIADAGARSWGRFYLALLLIDSNDSLDQALFATLLRRAWDAGGYHLQLEALSVAEFFGGSNEPHRHEILQVARELETKNWVLQGSLLEVLARFGEVTNPTTAEELRAHIRTVILHVDDMEHCRTASGIVASQFEDAALIGPYAAAIDGLTSREKAQLFAMAAAGADPALSVHLGWTLDQLTELVPTNDPTIDNAAKFVFADYFSNGPIEDAVVVNDAATPCLVAIRGWAKFEAALPPEAADPTPQQRSWYRVAGLLLGYVRNDALVEAEQTWHTLLLDPQQTIVTLAFLDAASMSIRIPTLRHLVENYPEQLRELFEWGINNPTEVPVDRLRHLAGADHFIIRMLGIVGDESTAARLHALTDDPDAGRIAVDAIRQIHRRFEQ